MSAVLRCCCPRCVGRPDYTTVSAYLDAHRMGPDEYVLDSEVALLADRRREPPERRVATFDDGSQVLLEIRPNGRMTAATRTDRGDAWSLPVDLDQEEF